MKNVLIKSFVTIFFIGFFLNVNYNNYIFHASSDMLKES